MFNFRKHGYIAFATVSIGLASVSQAAIVGPVQYTGGTSGAVTYGPDSIDAVYSTAPLSVGNLHWTTDAPTSVTLSFDYLITGNSSFNNVQWATDTSFNYANALSYTDGLTHHLVDTFLLDSANQSLFLTANAGGGTGSRVYLSNISLAPSAVPLPAALPLFMGGLGLMGLMGRRRKQKKLSSRNLLAI